MTLYLIRDKKSGLYMQENDDNYFWVTLAKARFLRSYEIAERILANIAWGQGRSYADFDLEIWDLVKKGD